MILDRKNIRLAILRENIHMRLWSSVGILFFVLSVFKGGGYMPDHEQLLIYFIFIFQHTYK